MSPALPSMIGLFLMVAAPALRAEFTERALAQLRDADPSTRVAAVRSLSRSLDPRIPSAMLPLLRDEGDSNRRLAARAIGSRWWQIGPSEVADYVAALKSNLSSGAEDERNMALRAIGLLERDYRSDLFSVSANGRWVIYERHSLPCLIDTKSETEELLGWGDESGMVISAIGNGPVRPFVLWHPKEEWAAVTCYVHRHQTIIGVWQHGHGWQALDVEAARKTIHGASGGDPLGGNLFFASNPKWSGRDLLIQVESGIREVTLKWKIESGAFQVIEAK